MRQQVGEQTKEVFWLTAIVLSGGWLTIACGCNSTSSSSPTAANQQSFAAGASDLGVTNPTSTAEPDGSASGDAKDVASPPSIAAGSAAVAASEENSGQGETREPARDPQIQRTLKIGRDTVEQLVRDLPGNPNASELLARFEFRFGSPERAAQLWQEVRQAHPQYTYALAGLGDFHAARGESQQAMSYYRQAAQSTEQAPAQSIQLAASLVEVGALDEALQLLQQLTKQQPELGTGWTELGALQLQQRDADSALQAYEQAVHLEPENPTAHFGMATAAARCGRRELAQKHQQLHRQYRQQDREALANERRTYNDLQAITTDVVDQLTQVAGVYLSAKQTDMATQVLERAAACQPTHVASRQNLVRIHQQAGRWDKAVRWQSEVVQLEPEKFSATFQLAMLKAQAGRIDDAEQIVVRFVEQYPEHGRAAITLAQFYVDVKPDLKRALAAARAGAELSQFPGDFVFLAALLGRAGDGEAADEALRRAESLNGESGSNVQQVYKQLRANLDRNSKLGP